MLTLSAVRKNRPGLTLRDVDLSIESGSAVLLSGATGSGKSTVLALARGDLAADAGTIQVMGRDLARLGRSSLARLHQHIGVVPQTLELLPERSVRQNIALPLEIQAFSRREIRARVAEMLDIMDLVDLGDRRVASVSLGQAQQIAVARALVTAPRVVIADEPTAHLDQAGRVRVIEMFERACAYGCAAVIATNDRFLLERGAHVGFSHVEIADGTLRVIANRELAVESLAYESYEVDTDTDAVADGADADLMEHDNVVPFRARIARAGGIGP